MDAESLALHAEEHKVESRFSARVKAPTSDTGEPIGFEFPVRK